MDTTIQDFIDSRIPNSNPRDDLEQLGYNPDMIFESVCLDDNLTLEMFAAMAEPAPQRHLANYAMTFFTFGVCIEKERNARATTDTLPPFTDGET